MTQWVGGGTTADDFFKYYAKAESLIEILEIEDCGSIGGFDRSNENLPITGDRIFDRFLTLVRKYDNEKDIEQVCQFDLNKLAAFFSALNKLRDTF